MIHELALSMGSDDPTKPDYSKYQKQLKKEGFWSNVMPLLHGRLSNIDYFWYHWRSVNALKVQTMFRARMGRKMADTEVCCTG
jgi:hypothetical protein